MTDVDATDRVLVDAIADGLPLVERPFAALGDAVGLSEFETITRLNRLHDGGVIKRFGLVVRHRALGFDANAMVVWDVPDDIVDTIGRRAGAVDFVTLCYRRPRRMPIWPYNLFCMIHGRSRDEVRALIAQLNHETTLGMYPSTVLFSTRCFKQRGARYGVPQAKEDVVPIDDIDRRVVNALQGGFPVSDHPFRDAARALGLEEDDLIARIDRLCETGVLSRFGPLYNAERMGGQAILAAMAVPEDDFERVADLVNAHPEVAHNYARDHRLNMWFVLSVENPERIDAVIAEIEAETGIHVFPMPKLEEYFVEFKVKA